MRQIKVYSKGNKEAQIHFEPGNREYVVRLYVDGVRSRDADYFTDDKDDACATAKHMVGIQ